jgi:hypothetical protein
MESAGRQATEDHLAAIGDWEAAGAYVVETRALSKR